MVKTGVRYRQANEMPNVRLPLNGCSVLVYPAATGMSAIRITGVYLTPAAHSPKTRVEMLTDTNSRMTAGGQGAGHIIRGDSNHPSWVDEYEKWASGAGFWALTDSGLPMFSSGSALGKPLCMPGNFLRDLAMEGEEQPMEMFPYQGKTGLRAEMRNRHPIFIEAPYGAEQRLPHIRRYGENATGLLAEI